MDIFSNIYDSIYRNLIAGGSYLLVLSGLKITLIITLAGLFSGTILGAVLCAMHYSNSKILKFLSKTYIVIIRGTPVLLLLMLLFYVVFARSRMDGVYVAVIAFGLNSASHIAEIMKAALESVDPGQVRAARTLGFTKYEAFYYITLPQASEFARPVYQNAVINLIQWTSVVGYIAVSDLTRVINGIGSRTADPFSIIFIGILLYLMLAYAAYLIFNLLDRKRRVKR